ncbi:MAG: ATP-binding protein [Bacilli bacterium]|nr:ATP-binding protein [Bacilli bacterium]
MENPFTLTFGVLPEQFISREGIADRIVADFSAGRNNDHIYIFTGVRGAGKTVMLNYLKREFEKLDDWIVINVNPELDILEGIASKLYEKGVARKSFLKKAFSFSFHGISFSIEGDVPVKNVETLLEKMLVFVKEHGQKVLVTIDEISNSKNIKVFSHTFKNLVIDGYPIYLLATGLNENVNNLQNENTLTFIYRAPKIEIKGLNLYAISRSYQTTLGLSETAANRCAALTEGYASAYQILGSILYRSGKKDIDDEVLSEFDQILEEINYGKMWSDLSRGDRQFLYGFSGQKANRAQSIIEHSSIGAKSYSKYRERLLKRGIVTSDAYGYLSLTLPRLFFFIQRMKTFEQL